MGTPHDAALGLPLVMTGPDSTRTLDNLTKWGVRLHGPDAHGDYEYRSYSGRYYWTPVHGKWLLQSQDSEIGPYSLDDNNANPPTIPPPDWHPHDGTKPGPTAPSRTDAASLSTRRDRANSGVLMRAVMEARGRMLALLATDEERTAFATWEEATNLWIDHIIEGGAA